MSLAPPLEIRAAFSRLVLAFPCLLALVGCEPPPSALSASAIDADQAARPEARRAGEEMPAALWAAFMEARQLEGGPGYAIGDELMGENPQMQFSLRFEGDGVHVRPSAMGPSARAPAELRMRLDAVGCEGRMEALAAGAPALDEAALDEAARRVRYARVGAEVRLEEWYLNGPLGLEQGFTVEALPRCAEAAELELAVRFGDTVTVSQADARSLGLRTESGRALRYGQLHAFDAAGRELSSALVATAHGARLVVDARGAALPITIDPLVWSETQRVLASDGAGTDEFGTAVSLSRDGTRALVGAGLADVGGRRTQGAAYVFVRTGGVWMEEQKLLTSDGAAGDAFGVWAALSGDGTRALIGAVQDDVSGRIDQGSAYVFVRSGSTWTEEQKLTSSDGRADDLFGGSVAISDDGSRALVGAPWDDSGLTNQGSAYVFVRSGSTWTEEQQLTAPDVTTMGLFGFSAAMSRDGMRALVGAYNDNRGSAHVFVRSGSTWTREQRLLASDGTPGDEFGWSVALDADGSRALVGAEGDDVGAVTNQGSAYVFARSGSTWTEERRLVSAGSFAFGGSVSLSADGSRALVGARGTDAGAGASQGAAYVFARAGVIWAEEQRLVATDAVAGDQYGYWVSLNGAGDYAVVGAIYDDGPGGSNQGSAYFLALGCSMGADCASGFCADGVCCDSACGGSDPSDCQACSMAAGAAADGTCGPVLAGAECGAAAGECDLAEACDGVSLACPADVTVSDGTACTDDGLTCTEPNVCLSGACAAPSLDCDDGDACTSDTCSEAGGCANTPIADCCTTDAECDDGDPRTADACDTSVNRCTHDVGGRDGGAVVDAGMAGPVVDAGMAGPDAGMEVPATGCSCNVARGRDGRREGALGLLALLGLGVWFRRRR